MRETSRNRIRDILDKIEQDDRNKKDIQIGMAEIEMLPNGTIKSKNKNIDKGFELSDYAKTQAFNRLGIPVRYGKRLMEERPDLVAEEFNHWAWQQTDMGVLLRVRHDSNYNGYVRGFLSERYSRLDNRDVVGSLAEILEKIPDADILGFHLDDRRTHLRLTLPELSANTGVAKTGQDDILRVGVDIINSEVGASSLVISPLVFRLVCSNGLRAWTSDGEEFRQRHIHLSENELFNRMNSAVVDSINQGDELLHVMNETKKYEIDNPLEVIEKLAKKNIYSQKLIDTAKDNYMIEPDRNLYGVINSFTRTAKDLDDEKRLDLEKFAGQLMFDKAVRTELIE